MTGEASIRKVSDLGPGAFDEAIAASGVGLEIGPFRARITADPPALRGSLFRLYRDYPLVPAESIYSFHVRLLQRRRIAPWRRRKVRFSVDGRVPHEDMPAEQALAVLEWGMNLVIALRSHRFLMLHAAVVARDGRALLLPAEPGFGKTTLCAALAHRGWQLYSDEFGLLRPEDGSLVAVPRPMALKNASARVIREFAPDAEFGPTIPGTRKGDVTHVKAPASSIARMAAPAAPRWVIFPHWQAGARCRLTETAPAETFMRLATNAFNYELLGEAAFDSVARLVRSARAWRLDYSDLDEAVGLVERLAEDIDE